VRPRGYERPRSAVALELGGPWAFYHAFWPAHNLEHLADLYSPEAQVAAGDTLWVPLILLNDTDSARQVRLRSKLPAGWSQKPEATQFTVPAHDSYPVQLTIIPAPAAKGTWQNLLWSADSNGASIGTITLRVDMESNGLPQ
jgi:hypothetical protein